MSSQTIEKNIQTSAPPYFIKYEVPLAEKTWFKTGGPAKLYCEPTTSDEFSQAITYAQTNQEPVFILGHGANILISDEGFAGMVIRPQLTQCTITRENSTHAYVTVGAGASFHDLITFCLENQLLGLEEFSGIPGTVGGSMYINIHYYEFLLAQFVECATVLDAITGKSRKVEQAWFNFGYDQSQLFDKNEYVADVTFKVKKATTLETAFAKGRHQEIIRHRNRRYPTQRTCGSFFRNFHAHEVAHTKKQLPFVAYYLDKVGIKGELQHNHARVSHQHANMIITEPGATSSDVITLARWMQEKVYETFTVLPQPECQLIGFKTYPLYSSM